MKMKCKIQNLYRKFSSEKKDEGVIEIKFNEICNLEELEKLKTTDKELELELKIYKEKRSLNANAYMWKLLSLASEKLKYIISLKDSQKKITLRK